MIVPACHEIAADTTVETGGLVASVHVRIGGSQHRFVSCYLPPSRVEDALGVLEANVEAVSVPTMLGGDFNTQIAQPAEGRNGGPKESWTSWPG